MAIALDERHISTRSCSQRPIVSFLCIQRVQVYIIIDRLIATRVLSIPQSRSTLDYPLHLFLPTRSSSRVVGGVYVRRASISLPLLVWGQVKEPTAKNHQRVLPPYNARRTRWVCDDIERRGTLTTIIPLSEQRESDFCCNALSTRSRSRLLFVSQE